MKKKYTISILLIVVIICIGFVVYFFISKKHIPEIKIIPGKINEISNKTIVIEVDNGNLYETDERNLNNVVFQYNRNSKVYRVTDKPKDDILFQVEQKEFIDNLKSHNESSSSNQIPDAPYRNILESVVFAVLKKEDRVRIYYYEKNNEKIIQKLVIELNKPINQEQYLYEQGDIKLEGTILGLKDDGIEIQLENYGFSKISTSTEEVKTIILDINTIINKKIKKSKEQFLAEQDVFNKKISNKVENINAPDWYIVENASVADLVQGMRVDVYIENENSKKSIAKKVEFYFQR